MTRPPRIATVATVARYTLIEQSSRRHLWWITGIALALGCGLVIVTHLSAFSYMGLATRETVELFASLPAYYLVLVILIVMGIGLVRADIDRGIASLILSRPVSALEYVLGRYLGCAAVLASAVMILGLGAFTAVALTGDAHWTLLYSFVVLAYNACLFLAIVTALGVLVGTIPSVAIGGIAFYALAQGSTYLLAALVDADAVTGFAAALVRAFVIVAPHVLASPLNAGTEAAVGDVTFTLPGPTIPDLVWSLAWLAGSLWATVIVVRRRGV